VAKNKLQQFAEMDTFKHVFHATYDVLKNGDYKLKGSWLNFFNNNNKIVAELGCGKGEYTVGLAQQNTHNNYIGIDIKGARMWRGATTVNNLKINNVAFIRTRIDFIEKIFAKNELDEIWITFPDPQKEKRRKRLTSPMFITRYQNVLKPNGIINLKTDSRLMYYYTLELAKTNNFEIIINTEDLYSSEYANEKLSIKTFYEQMFLKEGKKITYLKFRINDKPVIDTPISEEIIRGY
jgi:tRNA (guanine-N7-)-methyltransferase